ncbi:MAG: dienelactone hydrolase family protein [Gammaproteobacteria bacterium]
MVWTLFGGGKSKGIALLALVTCLVSDARAAESIEAHRAEPAPTAEEVSFSNGDVRLKGVLYKPDGAGPFPVLLFSHGSAPGMLNRQAFENLAPLFVRHGWAFFAPYRRGQGLSASAGPYVMDVIEKEQKSGIVRALPILVVLFVVALAVVLRTTWRQPVWVRVCAGFIVCLIGTLGFNLVSEHARARATVHALETDQLSDHLAAFEWLRHQSFVEPGQVAAMGNSFGGIITVLAAERVAFCAVVDAAGGAQTWSPELRARLAGSVRQSQAPIFFFQAENDYTTAPTEVLGKEMHEAGKPSVVKIYPAFGSSAADGHSFAWRGSDIWEVDVFRFLDAQCR